MKLEIKYTPPALAPAARVAEAAAAGISHTVREHLYRKNVHAPRDGWRKSDYYADAADSVKTAVRGDTGIVTIDKEGIALHYYGGTIYPVKGKALAIPAAPKTAGVWPSELGGEMALVWPKGESRGTLRDKESGEILYFLVPKATIKADKTVLPSEAEMTRAAETAAASAIWK